MPALTTTWGRTPGRQYAAAPGWSRTSAPGTAGSRRATRVSRSRCRRWARTAACTLRTVVPSSTAPMPKPTPTRPRWTAVTPAGRLPWARSPARASSAPAGRPIVGGQPERHRQAHRGQAERQPDRLPADDRDPGGPPRPGGAGQHLRGRDPAATRAVPVRRLAARPGADPRPVGQPGRPAVGRASCPAGPERRTGVGPGRSGAGQPRLAPSAARSTSASVPVTERAKRTSAASRLPPRSRASSMSWAMCASGWRPPGSARPAPRVPADHALAGEPVQHGHHRGVRQLAPVQRLGDLAHGHPVRRARDQSHSTSITARSRSPSRVTRQSYPRRSRTSSHAREARDQTPLGCQTVLVSRNAVIRSRPGSARPVGGRPAAGAPA